VRDSDVKPDPEALAEELIGLLEEDSTFDVEAFLSSYGDSAALVRIELERMARQGLLRWPATPGPSIGRAVERHAVRPEALGPGRAPEPDLTQPGALVADRFELIVEIGSGGMGRVVRAFDRDLSRTVALKLATPPPGVDESARRTWAEQFLTEARITGGLEHPGIPPVYELGVLDDGTLWFAMKLVEGRSLRQWIEELYEQHGRAQREMPFARRLEVVLRLCEALSYAHERGILHLDLKPGNVMLGAFGEVQLMDWGLARRSGRTEPDGFSLRPSDAGETRSGEGFGTPSYMAPEQARADGPKIATATDVFGLGALALHWLGGLPPYRGRDMDEVLRRAKAAERNDPALTSTPWPLPRELRAVLRRALDPDPEERYPTIAALAADLRAYRDGEAGSAWRDGPLARASKWVRRHPTATTVLVAAAAVIVLAGAAAWTWSEQRAELAQQETELERTRVSEAIVRATRLQGELHDIAVQFVSGRRPGKRIDRTRTTTDALAAAIVSTLGTNHDDDATNRLRSDARLLEAEDESAYRDLLRSLHLISTELVELDAEQRVRPVAGPWERVDALVRVLDEDPWRQDLWERWTAWVERSETTGLDRIDATGRDAADLEWAGMASIQAGLPRGKELLRAALDVDPSRYWASLSLGNTAYRSGDTQEALKLFHQALGSEPRASGALTNLCLGYRRLDADRALTYGRKAMQLAPHSRNAHLNVGLVCWGLAWTAIKAGDKDRGRTYLEESVTALRRATEIDPTHLEAHWALGRSLAKLQRPEGLVILEELAARHEDPNVWLELGIARRLQSDFAGYCKAVEHMLELDPDRTDVRCELAGVLSRGLGRVERSLYHYAEAERRGGVPPGPPEEWRDEARSLAAVRIGLVEPEGLVETVHAMVAARRRDEPDRTVDNAVRLLGTTTDVDAAAERLSAYGLNALGYAESAAAQAARCWRGEGYRHEPYTILVDGAERDVVVPDRDGHPLEADPIGWDERLAWKDVPASLREPWLERGRELLRFALHLAHVSEETSEAEFERILSSPELRDLVPAELAQLECWLSPLPAAVRRRVDEALDQEELDG